MKTNIGERIKEVAELKNITAQELADRLGRTRQSIYDIYNSRVSLNVELLIKIAQELKEPVFNFFIDDPSSYYDMIPNAIPIEEIFKHMKHIHENAKRGAGLVHLRIFKTEEGMYILDSEYRDLNQKLSKNEKEKFYTLDFETEGLDPFAKEARIKCASLTVKLLVYDVNDW